jgi:hypothetical protein
MSLPVCAIMQMEPRHDMIMVSVADAAHRAGLSPHIVIDKGCKRRRGDIFGEFPGLPHRVTYAKFGRDTNEQDEADHPRTAKLLADIEGRGSDLVVMNSYNRIRSIDWARNSCKPIIAVIHSIDQFLGDATAAEALHDPRFQFLTLGHHIASEFVARTGKHMLERTEVVEPFMWSMSEPVPAARSPDGIRRVAIPGAISLHTRDYAGLLDELDRNRSRYQGLRFVLGSGGKDRQRIEAGTRDRRLEHLFEYLPLEGDSVSNKVYFDSLRRAHAIMPLTPVDFEQYQRGRITTVVAASVGFAVPLVMDRWSSWCYRTPMFVTGMGLREQLEVLRDTTDVELADMQQRLLVRRRAALEQNGEAFARLATAALDSRAPLQG